MYTVQYINLQGLLHLQHSMQKKKKNPNITFVIVNASELSLFTDPAEITVMNYK